MPAGGRGRALRLGDAPARFGPDLWTLVERLGTSLVAARVLTRLPSPLMAHASFRLELASGRVVKGRRVETPEQARRIAELLPRLGTRHFPRALARHGSALLETWVPGTDLARVPADPSLHRRCGRILGAIHRAPVPDETAATVPGAGRRLALAERQLARLVELGVLPEASSRQALRHLRDGAPDRVAVGVIHRDFCAENIVLTPRRGFYVVDNETIRVDAPELDLARTWYRWPMTMLQREAFLAGYRTRRDPSEFLRHFPFWAIAVLVDTALFRTRARTPAASLPVGRLETLLRRLERGRGAAARVPA
jgi:Ser/Thr protein kinase RdoA (MazF antagonist)